MHLFEKVLSVTIEDIEFKLNSIGFIPWEDLLLNPRRLRGSDFLMRWSQGVWSEIRLTKAINKTTNYYAIPYGPSGVAPKGDVRKYELYFEKLEKAGLGKNKRPDLLLFEKKKQEKVNKIIQDIGGISELPFTPEEKLKSLIKEAIMAIECENSLWVAKKMPDYNSKLRPMRRLSGKMGMKKSAILPTIILKEEDNIPLLAWQNMNNLPIHIWHVFFDMAYGISLDRVQKLINEGLIDQTVQIYQAPGGATTKKIIYKIYYHYAYKLGISLENPKLIPKYIEDKNGHILPYIIFEGGELEITREALKTIEEVKENV